MTQYDKVMDFSEGLAAVSKDGKWGFIDKTGKEVIKPQYDNISGDYMKGIGGLKEGLALVSKNGKWGWINKDGKVVINFLYKHAGDFNEGLAAVDINGKTGYIDKTGKMAIKQLFYSGYDFSDGLAVVWLKDSDAIGNNCYIDRTGKVVLKSSYNAISSFHEGLAVVEIGVLSGVIDKKGKVIVKPQYAGIDPFSEGLARVVTKGGSGFIDKTGKEVIKPQFFSADSFKDGLASVSNGQSNFGFISNPLNATSGNVNVPINREPKASDQGSNIIGDSTLVPVKEFFEKLGKKVSLNNEKQTVTIGEGRATVTVGKQIAYIDGKEVTLAVKPVVINGNIMVPYNFIEDYFDIGENPLSEALIKAFRATLISIYIEKK